MARREKKAPGAGLSNFIRWLSSIKRNSILLVERIQIIEESAMKTKNKTQKNGRERGIPSAGMGPMQEWTPIARGTMTKNKTQKRNQEDRKRKANGWGE